MAKTTHSPTRAMQSAAKRGLKSIKDGEIDQTKVPDISVKGGRKIAAGQAISDDHVRSMANYHAGHAGACPTDGEEGADDMLWGGPAGASWSASRVAAMDATSLAEQDVDLEQLLADDQDVVLEVYSRGDLLDKVDLAKDEEGYIWAPILRSGTLAMRPGPNGEKLPEPLRFVPGHSADPRKEIGLQDIVDAFDDGAVQHVTIPTTHADDVLSNTGYIEKMRISDSTLRPGEKVIMAAHRFTEPDVEGKIERGSIANRSCGILYDYVNQETGRKYPAVVAHTALTNRPWVTGMESYGTLSEDSSGDRTVVPMLLSERRVVAPPTQRDKREVIYTLDPRESLERELKLADVQWGDEPSLSSIKSQLYDLFSDMGRSPDYEESSVGFYVMDVTASKALVQVDYRGDDPDDAWVVPFSLDDDGKLTLADFAQWTPVEQQWVTDDDADQDKSEVQALLQQEGDVNLSEEQLNLKALTSKARNKLPASAFVFPDEKAYPIHDLCLAGETKIQLLDGRIVTIADLVGREEWVYAYDTDQRAVIPAKAVKVWLTRRNAPVVRVTLDNGESVRCTGNHPFLLRDGTYRWAENLHPGDSLMPLYCKRTTQRASKKRGDPGKAYEQTWQPFYGFWDWTHRLVARHSLGRPIHDGYVIHHDDDDPFNNTPTNLVEMTRGAHCSLEAERAGWSHLHALHEGSRRRWTQEGAREKQSIVMRAENALRKQDGRAEDIGAKISEAKLAYWRNKRGGLILPVEEMYERYIGGESYKSLAATYGVCGTTIRRRFEEAGLPLKRDLQSAPQNHTVVSVQMDGVADIYDLTVPGPDNFALACGVFVHNTHARNALARAAQHESGARLAKIRAAVYRKYPQLKPDDGKSKKSNMANESTGGPMSLNLEAALNGLNLSEEARAFLQKLAEENQQLRTNLTEVQSTARKEQVATRVKELQGLGFPPGFCKEYEQIALADDGQVAATLNLSEGGTTKEVAQTSTQLAERLLTTLLSDDQTKLALNTSGSLLSSPINGRSGLTPDDQDKIDGKKPLSAEELLAEWRKAAPEAVDQLNLATKE